MFIIIYIIFCKYYNKGQQKTNFFVSFFFLKMKKMLAIKINLLLILLYSCLNFLFLKNKYIKWYSIIIKLPIGSYITSKNNLLLNLS